MGRRRGSPARAARTGIRLRATAIATLVVAAALLTSGVLLVWLIHRSLVGSVDAAGQARAHDVAAVAAVGRLSSSVASTGEESSEVQVVDIAGQVVAASPNVTGEPALLVAPPVIRQRQVLTRLGLPIAADGQSFRVIAEPVELPSGPGWVYVATSLAVVDLSTTRLAVLLSLGLPVLLLVVAASTWRAVGRALRPVEQIRTSAASISGTDPAGRVPVPASRDEIARLATTMNAMLARLQEAATRQRQFVGDASHEMRTPLAAMQTDLDVALAHPQPGLGSRALLARLSGQTRRLAQLLDGLLFLARTEESAPRAGHEPVDLDELVLLEARRLRQRYPAVIVDGPDAARVEGSAADLARLLRNLGDNAVAHGRGQVVLGLRVHGNRALLTVSDSGPGIPTADRQRVFERFTRLEAARGRGETPGGAGLGLAISQQIVRRHDGQIRIEDGPLGGATVLVELPLVGPAGPAARPTKFTAP